MNRKFISLFLYKKGRNLLLIVCAPARDGEDLDSQGEGSSQPDTISLASRTSQNTLDSDKVRTHTQSSEMMPRPSAIMSFKNKYGAKVSVMVLSSTALRRL